MTITPTGDLDLAGVPVVDLARASARELVNALSNYSCAFVINAGIPTELREKAFDVSTAFFSLPESERARVGWDGEGVWHGWLPGGNPYSPDRVGETPLVEWYMIHEPEGYPNWPERPTALRDVWTDYYSAMEGLANRLLAKIAEALGLPASELPAWTTQQFANLCLNHYPAQTEMPAPGQIRLPPHTDECTFTILTARDAPGGLQVWPPGRKAWVPVEFPNNAYLVQVGDLLDRWTNRQLRASVHRVVNPPPAVAAEAQRDSLIYFHFPALDTVVRPCVPALAATGGRPRFGPVTAREHLMKRQESTAYSWAASTG